MQKRFVYYLITLQAIICILTIIFFNGTADSGDSIVHYLFAKYAPYHPELYFDHWAKPVFVLLASPFAQLGFIGMKIFNSIILLITIFYTYKVTELLKIRNAIVVILIMMFAPLNYILTFSGLTEPMFAMFTIISIYHCLKGNYFTTAIIISFLPYVRSEGLIIMGVFGLYFMYKKNWKVIPWLMAGSLFYSLAGYFVYHDLLWVFTKIPYAKLSSVYGSGPITHFAEQLIYVIGVPIYVLFWVGFAVLIIKWIRKKSNAEEVILLLFSFSTFLIAHSLFWYLGIFSSYGLIRVLVGVMPIIAIIALMGFNVIAEDIFKAKQTVKLILRSILLIYILVFPFTVNPAAVQWPSDLMLDKGQLKAHEVSEFFVKQGGFPHPIVYTHCYLSIVLNTDPFDETKCKKVTRENISAMKSGDILIWDNVFAEFEGNIKKAEIDALPELIKLFTYKTSEGPEVIFSGYEKK